MALILIQRVQHGQTIAVLVYKDYLASLSVLEQDPSQCKRFLQLLSSWRQILRGAQRLANSNRFYNDTHDGDHQRLVVLMNHGQRGPGKRSFVQPLVDGIRDGLQEGRPS